MKIIKPAVAGTLESSDAFVAVEPSDDIAIGLESIVFDRFGEDILRSVREVLLQFGVTGAKVSVNDRGALDCVIRARVETAIRRAGGGAI